MGKGTLGRIINVIGEAVDECGPIGAQCMPQTRSCSLRLELPAPLTLSAYLVFAECDEYWSIHREAPDFTEQSTAQEILVTGIKASGALLAVLRVCSLWFSSC